MHTLRDVEVYRDDRRWMIEVPAIDGLTQARRVSEIEEQAVSLIATMLDVAPSAVQIRVTSIKVGDVDALGIADHVRAARTEAAEAEARAQSAMAQAIQALAGVAPTRDVGEMLGVSHQRVFNCPRHVQGMTKA